MSDKALRMRLAQRAERFDDRHDSRWSWWLFLAVDWLREYFPFCSHKVVNDQCGKPEHRFCIWCDSPMPNRELSS